MEALQRPTAEVNTGNRSAPAQDNAVPGHSKWTDEQAKAKAAKSNEQSQVSDKKPSEQNKGAASTPAPKPSEAKPKKKNVKRNSICLRCGRDHPLFFCTRYLQSTLEERRQFVKENGICPLCLLARHSLLECLDDLCRQCGENGTHNSTLCEKSYENKKRGFPPKDDEEKK